MKASTRRLLLAEPALFLATYFPEKLSEPDKPPKLEPFHMRLIEAAVGETRSLILYPAGHGKSTLVSTLLPIWAMCKNPNIRIALVVKNQNDGNKIMRSIHRELVDNLDLVRDFGPFRSDQDGKPWALNKITVAKRTSRSTGATLVIFGAGSKDVLGYRTDWTICDDVVDDNNSATPEARLKLRDWFDKCVETGPEHVSSRLTVVGTRFDPNDLYGDLLEMAGESEDGESPEKVYKTQKEDAVADEENHKTLWPDRWPWKRLMMQKIKMGTLNFNKRYRNIAVDASRMVFKEAYVNGGWIGKDRFPGCLDESFIIGDYSENWRRVAGFDPAVGTKRRAKFCAHVVLAAGSCIKHDLCYWVVDLERDQMTQPQMIDLILGKHQKYLLMNTQVEANSFQGGLVQQIEHEMKQRDLALMISPHFTNRVNKPDPETGIQMMGPWFERGAFHIPWGDTHSRRKMRLLTEELIMYPDGRTSDTVMALWFAWRQLELGAPRFGTFNRLPRDAPYWDRRIKRRLRQNPAYAQQQEAS